MSTYWELPPVGECSSFPNSRSHGGHVSSSSCPGTKAECSETIAETAGRRKASERRGSSLIPQLDLPSTAWGQDQTRRRQMREGNVAIKIAVNENEAGQVLYFKGHAHIALLRCPNRGQTLVQNRLEAV